MDQPEHRPSRWAPYDTWFRPFEFLLALPLLTIPTTVELRRWLGSSCPTRMIFEFVVPECPTLLVVATLAPGLLGLLCFAWLRSEQREVRRIAWLCGILAIIRLLAPAAALLLHGPTNLLMFGTVAEGLNAYVSLGLWGVTLAAFVGYASWRRLRQGRAGPRGGYDDRSAER